MLGIFLTTVPLRKTLRPSGPAAVNEYDFITSGGPTFTEDWELDPPTRHTPHLSDLLNFRLMFAPH